MELIVILLILILISLWCIGRAIPPSLQAQQDAAYAAAFARFRIESEIEHEIERARERRRMPPTRSQFLLAHLHNKMRWMRWIPPAIAVLMVSLIPGYFVGYPLLRYFGLI